jgi:hypothetical protein
MIYRIIFKMPDKVIAYCLKCKEKVEMDKPVQVEMKNGRPAIKGTHKKCGTKMFKIGTK